MFNFNNNPWSRYTRSIRKHSAGNDSDNSTSRIVSGKGTGKRTIQVTTDSRWLDTIAEQFMDMTYDKLNENNYLLNVTTNIGRRATRTGRGEITTDYVPSGAKDEQVIDIEIPLMMSDETLRSITTLHIGLSFFFTGLMFDANQCSYAGSVPSWVGQRKGPFGPITLEHVDSLMEKLVELYGSDIMVHDADDDDDAPEVPLADRLISLVLYDTHTVFTSPSAATAMQSDPEHPEITTYLAKNSRLEQVTQMLQYEHGAGNVDEDMVQKRYAPVGYKLFETIMEVMTTPVDSLRVQKPMLRQSMRTMFEKNTGYTSEHVTPRADLATDEGPYPPYLGDDHDESGDNAVEPEMAQTDDDEITSEQLKHMFTLPSQTSISRDTETEGHTMDNPTPSDIVELYRNMGEKDREVVLTELTKDFREKVGLASAEHVMLVQEAMDTAPGAVVRYRAKVKKEFDDAGVPVEDSTLDHMVVQYHSMLLQQLV